MVINGITFQPRVISLKSMLLTETVSCSNYLKCWCL